MKARATTIASRDVTGLGFAVLCAALAALVPPLGRYVSTRAAPLFVAAGTSAWAAVAALVVLAVRGEIGMLVDRRTRASLVAIGAIGTAGAFLLLFEGTHRATAVDATLCLQIEPAYALVIAWVFLGHRPTLRRCAAIALLLGGLGLAIRPDGRSSVSGLLLLLATPLCWQASHVIVLRKLRGVAPPALTAGRYVYGGALLAVYWLARGADAARDPATPIVIITALLAFQGIVLGYVATMAWYEAIARLDLARTTSVVVPLVPLLAFAASFVLLGEVATPRQWIGVALTTGGVAAFATAPDVRRASERPPAATAPLAAAAANARAAD